MNNIVESDIAVEFNKYIKATSVFRDKLLILPDTPQSFSTFPTIIIRETNNIDNLSLKSTEFSEYGDSISYQVDIYTKDVIIDATKYSSKIVINELRDLVHNFFRQNGFERTEDTNGEYIDLSVKRRTLLFNGTVQSWNKSII
jgi:hypothetical protein